MTSVVDIYNMALSHLGAARVMSVTESTKQASYCGEFYDVCRQQVLTDARWNFATGRRALSMLADLDPVDWAYAFQMPGNALRIWRVTPNSSRSDLPFTTEYDPANGGTVILTNCDTSVADITYDVKDPNVWPPHFVQALSYLLAAKIAVSIAGPKEGTALQQNCYTLYNSHLSAASAQDGNAHNLHEPEDEFLATRR